MPMTDGIGIAAIAPQQLITNLRTVFKCIQKVELTLFIANSNLDQKDLVPLDESLY